jgi:leucyl aminopeptidase
MPAPELTIANVPLTALDVEVLVVAAAVSDGEILALAPPELAGLEAELRSIGFTGGRDEVVRLPLDPSYGCLATSVAIVGIGREPSLDELRFAAGSATRQLGGVASIGFVIPIETPEQAEAVLEGAAMGAYVFNGYRSSPLAASRVPAAAVTVACQIDDSEEIIRNASTVAEAVALVKDLVNTPANDLFPESFAALAEQEARSLPVSVTVWDEARLTADGFGGILGVGQGSVRPPRLVKLSYEPAGATAHLALVGKGITFDSGGLSLKPMTGMVGMKYDMTGAATVLAVTLAAAKLGLNVRLTAWLCIAENMPSGAALRPNDVLRIRGGRTVEVLNTDAEGRLVLADGLVAASEEQPDAIVDVATLTGAAVVALGTRYAGVMGDDQFTSRVVKASAEVGELIWQMPLPTELRATLTSDVADITNATPGNTAAGMLLAGVFLQEFVGMRADAPESRIPWAHLDIAGPAKGPSAPYGFTGKGPTGVTVRTLIRLAEDFSRQ